MRTEFVRQVGVRREQAGLLNGLAPSLRGKKIVEKVPDADSLGGRRSLRRNWFHASGTPYVIHLPVYRAQGVRRSPGEGGLLTTAPESSKYVRLGAIGALARYFLGGRIREWSRIRT